MEWREYDTYRRWIGRWLPHILYGADGAAAQREAEKSSGDVASLPGGEIVKAY